MYGLGPYVDGSYAALGKTSDGTSIAGAVVDAVARESLANADGHILADKIARETAASAVGVITADQIVREVLLVPKTGLFIDGLVRQALVKSPIILNVAITEGATALDGLTSPNPELLVSIMEAANAQDGLRVVAGGRRRLAYDPLPQNHLDPQVRQIQEKINAILQGRVNTTFIDVTLDANSDTTTVVDSRIGPRSSITCTAIWPTVPELISCECQKGQVILHHTNADDITRRYTINVVAA